MQVDAHFVSCAILFTETKRSVFQQSSIIVTQDLNLHGHQEKSVLDSQTLITLCNIPLRVLKVKENMKQLYWMPLMSNVCYT